MALNIPSRALAAQNPPVRAGDLAVVVGAGTSGEAAVRLLAALGCRVRLAEKKPGNIPAEFAQEARTLGIEICCGEHGPEQFAGAALVVTSPGVPLKVLRPLLAAAGNPPLTGEMELACRYTDEPILAVTGSSGKTTTVSLAAAMLERAGKKVFLGGNIGTPLSAHILSGEKKDVLVLELSSFQLQTCSTFHPNVAVLLNLTENHLDHHADMKEYGEAKWSLFARQTAGDTAVLPPEMADEFRARGLAASPRVFAAQGRFTDIRLAGRHNQANAEAAFQAVRAFGVTEEEAREAVAAFAPLEHRLELVGEKNGVRFVNDSKCTTVDSLRVALRSFEEPVILLAGGKFKGGDLASLIPLLRERVRAVALFGASREIFEAAWRGVLPLDWHPDLAGAVESAEKQAKAGDVVLLSPATASYDLYANYKERGGHFRRLVRETP